MADIIHFKNTTLKVIRDAEPEFNIYMPNYEPEQAYHKAIAHLTKYYFKPHYKMKSLIEFLRLECQPKDLFSFQYT